MRKDNISAMGTWRIGVRQVSNLIYQFSDTFLYYVSCIRNSGFLFIILIFVRKLIKLACIFIQKLWKQMKFSILRKKEKKNFFFINVVKIGVSK